VKAQQEQGNENTSILAELAKFIRRWKIRQSIHMQTTHTRKQCWRKQVFIVRMIDSALMKTYLDYCVEMGVMPKPELKDITSISNESENESTEAIPAFEPA